MFHPYEVVPMFFVASLESKEINLLGLPYQGCAAMYIILT
jgi:hypothetical protein